MKRLRENLCFSTARPAVCHRREDITHFYLGINGPNGFVIDNEMVLISCLLALWGYGDGT